MSGYPLAIRNMEAAAALRRKNAGHAMAGMIEGTDLATPGTMGFIGAIIGGAASLLGGVLGKKKEKSSSSQPAQMQQPMYQQDNSIPLILGQVLGKVLDQAFGDKLPTIPGTTATPQVPTYGPPVTAFQSKPTGGIDSKTILIAASILGAALVLKGK